jgi:hypothetical protein
MWMDLIIVPAGIALFIRLIPPEIMAQHRDMAVSRAAAVAIVIIWIVAIGVTVDEPMLAIRLSQEQPWA